MPCLIIRTSKSVSDESAAALAATASTTVAKMLGKSEDYVMVVLEPPATMCFAGSAEPCAYLELKSIGLPTERTADFSAALCGLIEDQLHIPATRIYVEFSDAPRAMWGWNHRTF